MAIVILPFVRVSDKIMIERLFISPGLQQGQR
jgi:hypothetical protein